MADVQHKRGTRADLNALATANGLLVGQVYFITDEDRMAIATGVGAYQATAKEGEGLPAAIVTLDDTNLVVADATNVQSFAEDVDSALLKARGTGVTSTYVSTVAIGGTTFAQPAVEGEINSDQGYFSISYAGATGITVANLSATSTYVYIDNAGALQQQTAVPTRQDWSRKVFTMRIGVDTTAGTILGFEYLNNPIGHYANSIRDLYTYLLAQGIPLKKDQVVTGRAGDLGFDVSAGSLMEFGGTGDINNANIKSFNAVANASYTLLSRTAVVSVQTDLVKFWDNGGTITALGSTTLVGHRLFRYADGAFAMQYGQGNYANMDLAKAGVVLEDYVLNPILEDATFFGWWLIESTATNTGGTTLTDFAEYTIGIQGGSSGSLAGCLLKGNNLSDLQNTATARANLGLGDFPTTLGSAAQVLTVNAGATAAVWAAAGGGGGGGVTPTNNDILVVAGGGSGAASSGAGTGGGGGAGALLYEKGISIATGTTYSVVIGAGGSANSAGSDSFGNNGSDSSAFSLTAIGGGGGGRWGYAGLDGGSGGGGGGRDLFNGYSNFGGSSVYGQGNDGGNATTGNAADSDTSGGGGGSGGLGHSAGYRLGGYGGQGRPIPILGETNNVYYASGGGGGTEDGATPGASYPGGGGYGGSTQNGVRSADVNTGGGGGGASGSAGGGAAGNGGSGVVILRTLLSASATTGSPTVTTDGSYNIYKFTGAGSITF